MTKQPTPIRHRRTLLLLATAALVIFNVLSIVTSGKFRQGMPFLSFPVSVVENHEQLHRGWTEHQWTPRALTDANQTDMLVVPEEMYNISTPLFSNDGIQACPVQFFVYDVYDLPADLGTDLEEWAVTTDLKLENMQLELALIRLFRTSPCRVRDPNTADIFVVPYMHTAHCVRRIPTEGYKIFCGNVPHKEVDHLLDSLTHFNDETRDRHAFILGWGTHKSKIKLVRMPLTLTVGWIHRPHKVPKSAILIPPLNARPTFQPSVILERGDSWWTRPRKYSMAVFNGGLNPRMPKGPRRYRKYFKDYAQQNWNGTMAGKPYLLVDLADGKNDTKIGGGAAFEAYQDSVVCPVLPGDSAWQRRFFDVLMSGCLPLVIEWDMKDGPSWHIPKGDRDLDDVYPFFPGGFYDNPLTNIDYDSFVVRVPGKHRRHNDFSEVEAAIEKLLANTTELQRRQVHLMENAPKFAFGLGIEAHKYDDMFARILRAMGQYSAKLSSTQEEEQQVETTVTQPSCFEPDKSRMSALLAENPVLSKPVINLGMPKSGSTTLEEFFDCAGWKASHWQTERHGYLGKCMEDAVNRGDPPLSSCNSWYRKKKKGISKPDRSEDADVEAMLQLDIVLPSFNACVFPQMAYLDEFHNEAPNATFILNFRPVSDWSNSVIRWSGGRGSTKSSLAGRMAECDLPGLPTGVGGTAEELSAWWCQHVNRVRQFVEKHPSHKLIEIDLYNDQSSMPALFQASPSCWGHANKNPPKNGTLTNSPH